MRRHWRRLRGQNLHGDAPSGQEAEHERLRADHRAELPRQPDVQGQPCRLEICDTAGQEDYASLRSASYANADLFLLCFSLENRVSFENLEAAWLHELRKHRGTAAVLLVGTKLDQYKEDRPVISKAEISELSKKTGFEYVQCSALTLAGIQDVIDKLLNVLHGVTEARQHKRRKKCSIL